MTRSSSRRHSAVQTDKTLPAPPPSEQPDEPFSTLESSRSLGYWRLVLFLWGTSFVGLFVYEWLAAILKTW